MIKLSNSCFGQMISQLVGTDAETLETNRGEMNIIIGLGNYYTYVI